MAADHIGKPIALKGRDGHFLGAEPTGRLRHTEREPHEWERWLMNRHDGKFTFRSAHYKFLSTGNEAGCPATADRDRIGGWECWMLEPHGTGQLALKSCFGKYLCLDDHNAVNANRPGVGEWERFWLIVDPVAFMGPGYPREGCAGRAGAPPAPAPTPAPTPAPHPAPQPHPMPAPTNSLVRTTFHCWQRWWQHPRYLLYILPMTCCLRSARP